MFDQTGTQEAEIPDTATGLLDRMRSERAAAERAEAPAESIDDAAMLVPGGEVHVHAGGPKPTGGREVVPHVHLSAGSDLARVQAAGTHLLTVERSGSGAGARRPR